MDKEVRLRTSVATALQPSLRPPNRNRSISVDDFRDDLHPNRPGLPADPVNVSSSESDDDENDDLARRRTQERRRRRDSPLDRIKRTASSLSLESLQNDSDDSAPPLQSQPNSHVPRPAITPVKIAESSQKRPKLTPTPIQPQQQSMSAQVQPNHAQRTPVPTQTGKTPLTNAPQQILARPPAPAPPPPPQAKAIAPSRQMARAIACAKCGAMSHPVDGARLVPECQCARQVNESSVIRAPKRRTTSPSEDEVITIKTNSAVTNEPVADLELVNIASIAEMDGTGWDRFIFFSFRPQRFHFPKNTYLSAFSPFAAVASVMDGVSAKGVCAVCGGSEALIECCRCPLAFHSKCIDPLRQRMAAHPWFCDACQAVKGSDMTLGWNPLIEPPSLPSPATGFKRLISDAREGNPIDFVFHPTLLRYYTKDCGADWMRCSKCNEVTIAEDGVLVESVYAPFECRFAFWGENPGPCHGQKDKRERSDIVKRVEAYNKNRSRRRNTLFFYGFGEEDRESYGFPPLNRNEPVADVIVIDDEPEPPESAPAPVSATVTKPPPKLVLDRVPLAPRPRPILPARAPPQVPTPETVALSQRPNPVTTPLSHKPSLAAVVPGPLQTSAGGTMTELGQFNSSGQPMKSTGKSRTNAPVGNMPASSVVGPGLSRGADVGFGRPRVITQSNRVVPVSEQRDAKVLETAKAKDRSLREQVRSANVALNGQHPGRTSDPAVPAPPSVGTAATKNDPGGQPLIRDDEAVRSHPAEQLCYRGPPGSANVLANQGVRPVEEKREVPENSAAQPASHVAPKEETETAGSMDGAVAGTTPQPWGDAKEEDEKARVLDRSEGKIQEQVLECIASIDFDVDTEDCLTDLALANDRELFQLYTGMYRQGHAKFKRQATRLARRRSAGTGTVNAVNGDGRVGAYPPTLPSNQSDLRQQATGAPVVQSRVDVFPVGAQAYASNSVSALQEKIRQIHALHRQEHSQLCAAMSREIQLTPANAVAEVQRRQRAQLESVRQKYEYQLRALTGVNMHAQASIRQ